METLRTGRASYGWVVVGVSTAVNALAWGPRATFALFFVAMLQEFAWGRGPTALGYSLSWLCFVVWAPVAGWLHDRWGARTAVTIGGVVLGLALAGTGQVTSPCSTICASASSAPRASPASSSRPRRS